MRNDDDWPLGHPLRGLNLRRVEIQGVPHSPTVLATADIAGTFGEMTLVSDQVWVAGTLDSESRLVSWNILGKGQRPVIRPIDVFAGAIIHSGIGAFLVRNSLRGSTSLKAAEEFDRDLLETLRATGEMMGYAFLDFVVLEKNCIRSVFAEVALSEFSRQRSLVRSRNTQKWDRFSSRPKFRFEAQNV